MIRLETPSICIVLLDNLKNNSVKIYIFYDAINLNSKFNLVNFTVLAFYRKRLYIPIIRAYFFSIIQMFRVL